jgi:hemerythrin HHE cation binding domain-containing protein
MTVTYGGATEQVRQFVHHHAVLRRGLERRAGALCEAAENGLPFQRQMRTVREYLTGEILPHAQAEERTLYPAAAAQARGSELVRALTAEHRELEYLAGRLQPGAAGTDAATVSEWIATLFAGHVAKENDLLLPALTGSGADLAALLADMHERPSPRSASAR